MTELQQQVIRWLSTGETGLSSETMAFWLAFKQRGEVNHPHDPDDLDRCLRLLAAAPGLRKLLPAMRGLSEEWAALVERWDEIEASHLDEVGLGWSKGRRAPITYALMREILDKIRNERRIRINDSVSIGVKP